MWIKKHNAPIVAALVINANNTPELYGKTWFSLSDMRHEQPYTYQQLVRRHERGGDIPEWV